jgi:hypothetical protein
MVERESPPDTLIGLGPPEPPEKYGAHPADAPETLRAWSTSGKVALEEETRIDESFVPVEPLFPGRIWPISAPDEDAAEVRLFRRPAARNVVFWVAPALLTAAALGASAGFSSEGPRPAAVPPAIATHPSTTRVVGGPWVLRQDVSLEQESESTEPARIFFRERGASSHHHAGARLSAPPVAQEPGTELRSDPSRVQAVADAVQLEDDVPEPKRPDAVEPEAADAEQQ